MASQGADITTRARMVADDRGSMFIEVLVSAVLLIVISLATLAVIDRAGEASGMNRARTVSTTLAQKDQDKVRQWPFSRIAAMFGSTPAAGDNVGIYGVTPSQIDVDGRMYTVNTEMTVVGGGGVPTACLAGWKQLKLRIRTTVTPPAGHKMKPVTMETYRVPSIADEPNKGSVIVRLMRADGSGSAGVTVSVTPVTSGSPSSQTAVTGSDGCAVINDVDPGLKSVEWSSSGDKGDENGAVSVERFVTVSAGKTAQMAGRWDEFGTRTVNLTNGSTAPGAPAAKWKTITFIQSGVTTVYNGRRTFPTTPSATALAQHTADRLFPFETVYGAFAGTCWGNNPDIWPGATQTATAVAVGPGSSGAIDVLMPLNSIGLVNAPSPSGWRIHAFPRQVSEMGPCGETATTNGGGGDAGPASGASGVAQIALPFGTWSLCITNGSRAKKNVVLNNTPDGATTYPPSYRADTTRGLDGVDVSNGQTVGGGC